jgi:hypothetical protein
MVQNARNMRTDAAFAGSGFSWRIFANIWMMRRLECDKEIYGYKDAKGAVQGKKGRT